MKNKEISMTYKTYENEEEFNNSFVEEILDWDFRIDDDTMCDWVNNAILPLTGWENNLVPSVGYKTICYWYLLQLFYVNFERDTEIGRRTEDIYALLQTLEVK